MSTCWPGLHAGRWMTRDSLEEQLGRFRKLPVAWLRGSPRALFPRPRTAPLPLSWSRCPLPPGTLGAGAQPSGGGWHARPCRRGGSPWRRISRGCSAQLSEGDQTSAGAAGRFRPAWGRLRGCCSVSTKHLGSLGLESSPAVRPSNVFRGLCRSRLSPYEGVRQVKASPWVWSHLWKHEQVAQFFVLRLVSQSSISFLERRLESSSSFSMAMNQRKLGTIREDATWGSGSSPRRVALCPLCSFRGLVRSPPVKVGGITSTVSNA